MFSLFTHLLHLMCVQQVPLVNKSLAEVQQILKCGHSSGYTNLVIEYDVSLNQSVEFSMGPLLIEIERPMNDKLGLVLSHYNPANTASQMGPLDPSKLDEVTSADMGVYISSILPASIADRYVERSSFTLYNLIPFPLNYFCCCSSVLAVEPYPSEIKYLASMIQL